MTSEPFQIRRTIEVQVTRDTREHTGTHWHLFAQYAGRFEAFQAIERAKAQGYTFARIVEHETINLA